MSESISAEIRLTVGRRIRGRFQLTVMEGSNVLAAAEVNPHKLAEIEAFLQRASAASEAIPVDVLRARILQLAAPSEPAAESDDDEGTYFSTDDGLYWRKRVGEGSVPVKLTNFTAQIVADVAKDDGIDCQRVFTIEAVLDGRTLRFPVSASQFAAMNWPIEKMGPGAIVFAGPGVKDHARAAIQELSTELVSRTVYTHTGWRKVGEQRLYLHAGGAIGANGNVEHVEVDLAGALGNYVLPTPPTGNEQIEAVRATLDIIALGPDEVTMPVLCSIYRAPFGVCDVSVFLIGPTGAKKSEVAALACQHFGADMARLNLPANWSSTENALEGLTFSAKDTLLAIDDFAPSGGQFDVIKLHQKADRVLRAQGNRSARQRMRRDGTLCSPCPPRGSILATGEDLPKGVSLRARLVAIEVGPLTVNVDRLTACQNSARSGSYALAMAGFIRWISSRYELELSGMAEQIVELRASATRSNVHARTPEAVANLQFGFLRFLTYAVSIGAITPDQSASLSRRCWAALGRVAQHQVAFQQASDPAQRFLDLVTSALTTGKAHLAGRDGQAPRPQPSGCGWRHGPEGSWIPLGARIGWIEGPNIYLDPDASYAAAQDMARGEGISITQQTLRKRLHERGILVREGGRDELTVRRMLDGVQRHVLQLRPDALLAPPPATPGAQSSDRTAANADCNTNGRVHQS